MIKPKALLLNGCGTSGCAHLGFLWTLKDRALVESVQVVSGTSIGSIAAFLFALGLDLLSVLRAYETKSLLDLITVAKVKTGVASVDGIIADLIDLIESFGAPYSVTFAALREKTGKTLIVNATEIDFSNGKLIPVHFSPDTAPNMLVLDAIRCSINIPIMFNLQQFAGKYYCDGVLTCDLPFVYLQQVYNIQPREMIAHRVLNVSVMKDDAGDEPDEEPGVFDLAKILISHYIHSLAESSTPRAFLHSLITTTVEARFSIAEMQDVQQFVHSTYLAGIASTAAFLSKYTNDASA